MQSRIRRKLLKALFPVFLSGCAAAPDLVDRLPSFGRDRYREQVLAARMAEQSGELLRARKSYEELLQKNPDKVDLHHRLGVLCQKSGDEAAAINYLKKAHELSPTNVEVLCDLGYSHYLQGRADEAVAVYRQAQQINPSHARTQSNLGIALIDVGEVSAAMTTLRQSMSESDAASTVGFALAQKGDLLQARDYFTRALDADPNSQKAAEALVQLGELMNAGPGAVAMQGGGNVKPATPGGTAAPAEGNVPRATPETVDFESLYSQKLDPVTGADLPAVSEVPAANAAVQSVAAESGKSGRVERATLGSQWVADSRPDVQTVERVLPPIEGPLASEGKSVTRAPQSTNVVLSHTSLRMTETAQLPQLSERDEESADDLAAFVDSGPIEAVHGLESRRRSGGVIEPMRKTALRAAEPVAETEIGLPPVTDKVPHGPHRTEQVTNERVIAKTPVAVDKPAESPVTEASPSAALKVISSLPTMVPQAVPNMAGAMGTVGANSPLANGQMVLIQGPNGQIYCVPLMTQQAAGPWAQPMPQSVQQPQLNTAVPQAVQQAAWFPTTDPHSNLSRPVGPESLPQIFASGQPVSGADAGQASGLQPTAPTPGYPYPAPYAPAPAQLPAPAPVMPGMPGPQGWQQPAAWPQAGGWANPMAAPQYMPGMPQTLRQPAAPAAQHSQYPPYQQVPAAPPVPAATPTALAPVNPAMQVPQGLTPRDMTSAEVPAEQSGSALPTMTAASAQPEATLPVQPVPVVQPVAAVRPAGGVRTASSVRTAAGNSLPTAAAAPVVPAPTAVVGSQSASVGGLPLAFLRSFYAQMSPEQQAVFWRDLRQMSGGSAAEEAAYRELAESSTGIACIEAAITMLAVFQNHDLADRLLSKCTQSADPAVQQAARTALSMVPLRSGTTR